MNQLNRSSLQNRINLTLYLALKSPHSHEMNPSHSQPHPIHYTPQPSLNLRHPSPIKQQWSLLNQYKALQFQRQKLQERQLQNQKKQILKRELDSQLNSKNSIHIQEIQADKRYYQFVVKQANAQKEKQEREKLERMVKRRNMEEDNARVMEMTKNSRSVINSMDDSSSKFEIGTRSQIEQRLKSDYIKKTVIDTLDEQLKLKQQQKQHQREQQFQQYQQNQLYQQISSHNRNIQNNKHQKFRQNEEVYQYYNELQRQKRMKDMQLEHKFVDQAAERKKYEEEQRRRFQQWKKTMIKEDVKQTLDRQVKQHNKKRSDQQRINPEDYSYGVIGNIFRQRKPTYDKHQYMQQLQAQASYQRLKKQRQNFMSDQEYRLNMNQLNKVVNGEYTFSSYVDRSLGTIGDNNRYEKRGDVGEVVVGGDVEQVRGKLEGLRNRNRSQVMTKGRHHDKSAYF